MEITRNNINVTGMFIRYKVIIRIIPKVWHVGDKIEETLVAWSFDLDNAEVQFKNAFKKTPSSIYASLELIEETITVENNKVTVQQENLIDSYFDPSPKDLTDLTSDDQ